MTTEMISDPLTEKIQVRIGYWILVLLAASSGINSFVRIFLEPFPEFVVGWVAASLFAAIVLLIPFRKGERWAWYASWIFGALLASVSLWGAQVGVYYLAAAAVVALCLLLTHPIFFQD